MLFLEVKGRKTVAKDSEEGMADRQKGSRSPALAFERRVRTTRSCRDVDMNIFTEQNSHRYSY